MGTTKGNIYTIAKTAPFLDTLAAVILRGDLPRAGAGAGEGGGLSLTATTLLLPSRRACRAMRDAFLRVSNGEALLLPRIRPIGDVDEEASILSSVSGIGEHLQEALSLPPAVSDIERRLALTRLVLAWVSSVREGRLREVSDHSGTFMAATPAQAAKLASELMKLMDAVETEQVDLSRLHELVPEEYSEHWQLTLEFLKIVTEHWPTYLKERGLMPPMERRNALLLAEAERFRAHPPAGPVIAAGITGSIPASASLLKAVCDLPEGALVLPGLDLALDARSWDALVPGHPGHPQYGLKKLLDALGVARSDVSYLPGTEPGEEDSASIQLVSDALRPAETTDSWRQTVNDDALKGALKDAKSRFARIVAPTAQDEADVVSLILRRAVETPGLTAALVTPDRLLGRRVSVRLEKWGLRVDDSAGRPLVKTVPGAFLVLVADAVRANFAPDAMMSLLKHPLTRLGRKPGVMRGSARALELLAFRQPMVNEGLDAIEAGLERTAQDLAEKHVRHPILKRQGVYQSERALELIRDIREAFAPLTDLAAEGAHYPVRAYVEAHIAAAENLSKAPEGAADVLWGGEAGETLALYMAGLLDKEIENPEITLQDYPDFFQSLIAGQAMRPRVPVHPRLFIWGPLEARLQQTDIVILGGLNEGTWPAAPDEDPWLSRPMRHELGLPQPEEKIGRAAHDFSELLGGAKVYLTSSAKIDGVPSVPSRWLLRLEVLAKGMGLDHLFDLPEEEHWLEWAAARVKAEKRASAAQPEPRPPVEARPRSLSVTQVEEWAANPYAIYARHILGLEALPELGVEPDAALRGGIIHRALHRFTVAHPQVLPDDISGALMGFAEEEMAALMTHPRVAAFWRPRLKRFADWFADTESERRRDVAQIVTEVSGHISFDAPFDDFTLKARADRIDLMNGGGAQIYDYKTGVAPNDSRVKQLYASQLPLEAAILLAGGFAGVDGQMVQGLHYVSATGGEPAGEDRRINCDDVGALADKALDGLKRLVARYDQLETSYRALRRLQFDAHYRYDDYAHLARVKEWAASDASEG